MPKSQSGFSLVFFVLIIFLLLGLIIGGSLVIKHFFSAPTKSLSISDKNLNLETKVEKEKVLFVSKNKLFLASVDGNNIESFNKDLDGQLKSISAGETVSPNRANLLLEGYSDKSEAIHHVLSLKDKSFVKIDEGSIKKKFDYTEIYFWTWSADSKKIVYSAINRSSELPGNITRAIGEYDIGSHEVKELYSEKEYKTDFFPGRFGIIDYDSDKQLVVLIDDNSKNLDEASSDNSVRGYLLDLKTKQKIQFKEPNIVNNGTIAIGQYFIVDDSEEASKRKELKIFSTYKPTTPIADINLDKSDSTSYNRYITWSPNYDFFSIQVIGAQPDSAEKFSRSRADLTEQLFIYSKEGKFISRTNIPGYQNYFGTKFSGDGKRFLMFGDMGDDKQGQVYWQVYDAQKDNSLIKQTSSSSLGRVIFWYE